MEVKIRHENIELTDAIVEYTDEKIGGVEQYMDNLLYAEVVLGKSTNHHRKGDVFHCRVNIEFPGGRFHAEQFDEDLYKAINECKEVLKREITKFKETNRNY